MHLQSLRRIGWLAALALALLLLATGGGTATAQDAQWLGQFWNNRDLAGAVTMTRWENSIDFNWMGGSPDPRLNGDNFSARWTRTVNFPAGNYRFMATMDDGMRIWIDNTLVVDAWNPSQEHTVTFDRFMNGNHAIRIDYFEAGGMAVARFNWQAIGAGGGGGTFFPNWQAEYFNNPTLSGAPVLVRDDRYLNQNWGTSSPGPGVNADFWSARWTRIIEGVPGSYRIILSSDDGSRLFVNNVLVIDNWLDQATTREASNFVNAGGPLNVRVEYYDSFGDANIRVDLIPLGGTGGTGGGGIPGVCTTTPSGLQAQSTATVGLNIRRGPSTQFEAMGQMAPCQILPLSGFRNGDGTWVQVVTANGQTGWVAAEFVRLGVTAVSLTPSG